MSKIFVLIDDKKKDTNVKHYHSFNEEFFKQENQKGWGIYFAVNEFGGNPRQDKYCLRLRYVYGDLDIAKAGDKQTREEKEAKKKKVIEALIAKCEPSVIVDTSNGVQPLWKITDGDIGNRANYIKAIKGVVEWSKGYGCLADRVYDTARILRQPGFYHQKEEPYLCKIVHQSTKSYTIAELNQIFPYVDETPTYVPPQTNYTLSPIDEAIQAIDIKDIVIKAYNQTGRIASFDSQDRLVLDGRQTGTFQGRKDGRGYIASSSHEPVQGNRVTVVADILSINNKDARQWLIKEFGLDWQKEIAKKQVENLKPIQPNKDYKKRYTWGTQNLDDNFGIIKRKNFIVLSATRGAGKTTFAFNIACKNALLGHRVLFISLEMEKDQIKEDFARRRAYITIPEERDYDIPKNKQRIYADKIKEIDSIETLLFSGVQRGSDITWDGVKLLIAEHKDLDLVIIDNLDLIERNPKEEEWDKQKRIVKNIMNFTSDQQIPIILIHHYRKSNGKGKSAGGMDEISGSGKIADSADFVVKVSRNSDPDAKYPEKYCSTVHLQKARGYNECSKGVYFLGGTFVDEAPMELDPRLNERRFEDDADDEETVVAKVEPVIKVVKTNMPINDDEDLSNFGWGDVEELEQKEKEKKR